MHDRPVVDAERRARRRPDRRPLRLAPHLGPQQTPDDNGYAHPVENVRTLVDLDTLTVVKVEDDGVVPIPKKSANYSTVAITDPDNVPYFPDGPRTDVKPFDIVQHEGPSFTVNDHHLEWQKWDLRIGFTPREGLVLHQINYAGRSIIYRASLSEMFVPYGDPSLTHYRKLVLDEGEYGIGLLTNSLELGCDCLGEIVYLDGVVNDNDGHPIAMKNAICLHEEDHGIAWKHTDFRTGHAEVRRMRRMVISSIVTVGNYEYGYYWYLYQDGSIEYEVKLSGVISNGAIEEGVTPEYGTIVAPGVYGPHHQHFFNVRLDMAVDGTANRVYEVTPTAMPEGPDNPVGNAWRADEVLIEDETMSRREADPLAGRYWKIVNENVTNELGQPVAYKLVPEHTIKSFAHPGSAVARRAGFTANPLWVTAYDRDEVFATGDYPNQSRRRRRPARLRRGGPEPHRHRRGALVHLRRQPRRPPGGLAGHAGPPDRLPAAPGRLLRRQPGPRQPPARRRPLPPLKAKRHKPNSKASVRGTDVWRLPPKK